MPDCVHLSRDMIRIETGGANCCGNTVDVRRCLSLDQSSEYCIPNRSFDGFLSGIGTVGDERKLVKAVSCDKCEHHVFPVSTVTAPPMSSTRKAWEKIHAIGRDSPDIQPQGMATGPEVLPVNFHAPIRNMMYHVMPDKKGVWRRTASALARRLHVFNGKRVVGIVCDENTEDPQNVVHMFGGKLDKVIVKKNSSLREMATFFDMLKEVASDNDQEVTFFSHSKGVRHPVHVNVTVHEWAQVMYETLLDYLPIVDSVLGKYAMAGSFKKNGKGFASSVSDWHYSGSYYWFRNKDLFARAWNLMDYEWYGVESYPSIIFRVYETGNVFYEGSIPELELYNVQYWNEFVRPSLNRWREANRAKLSIS